MNFEFRIKPEFLNVLNIKAFKIDSKLKIENYNFSSHG